MCGLMSCSLSAEAEINIRYPSRGIQHIYVSFGNCKLFWRDFPYFPTDDSHKSHCGSLAYVGYTDLSTLQMYDVVASRTIVELSMYVYRYCKYSAISGDGTKRVGSYNLLPPLTPRSRAAERRSLHCSSEDGPKESLYLIGTNSTTIRGKVIE